MAKSEYLQREDAAKKQLGAKGVAKRVKQVPRAARLSVKELTGVNISRKGVSVDPGAAALAAAGFIPFGKSLSVGAKIAKMAVPKATRVARAATRLSKSAKASLTANQMQNKYYLGKVDEAMSEWYSARNLPNPTRGELMTPANKEMYSRWGAEKTRKAADAIEQSGRLDPEINADRLLGRLEQFKYLKKRRGGR